ncbi:MAG TPA: glycosyltransferase family 61 protein [Stellaceae bacterium]|jgi:hypothetical protein|nr:glycosyltransferase family 61 protein [Stellaceae bacterium]
MARLSKIEQRILPPGPGFHVPRPLNLSQDLQGPGILFRSFNIIPQPLTVWRLRDVVLKYSAKSLDVVSDLARSEAVPVEDGWEKAEYTDLSDSGRSKLEGTYVSLVPFKVRRNYCHFLLEGLTRAFLVNLWDDLDTCRRFLGDSTLEGITQSFVDLIFPAANVHYISVKGINRIEDLIIPNALKHPMQSVHPALLKPFRQLAFETTLPRPLYNDRIYIDRGTNRGAENRDELLELLARYEFEVLKLETMSAVEQINAFRFAKVILGEHGAGLSNIIFCENPSDATLIEIMPRSFGTGAYWYLAAGVNVNYCVVLQEGDYQPHFDSQRKRDRMAVNTQIVEQLIRKIVLSKG